MKSREIHILERPEEMVERLAEAWVGEIRKVLERRALCFLALAGGRTPEPFYRHLAERYREALPWERLRFFLTDERFVPPDAKESNYRMVREALLDPLAIPKEHRFPYPTVGIELREAARKYEETLLRVVGKFPRFDLVLLGVGEDGHVASLFPRFVPPRERWVAPVWGAPKPPRKRLTLTYRTLNLARSLFFLVMGPEKAEIIASIFRQPKRRSDLPAQRVSGERNYWFLDREAGRLLL